MGKISQHGVLGESHAVLAKPPADAFRAALRAHHLRDCSSAMSSGVWFPRARRPVETHWTGQRAELMTAPRILSGRRKTLEILCGGGVPSSHPSLGVSVFFLRLRAREP